MTIVIVSVTIMTAIAKNYYHDSVDMWLWDIVSPHNHVKKICKIPRNSFGEINLGKELEGFLLEGYKSGLWERLVSLPQMKNTRICNQILISLSFRYTCTCSYTCMYWIYLTCTHSAKLNNAHVFLIKALSIKQIHNCDVHVIYANHICGTK